MMTYQIDMNNDGYVRMAGATTIDRYKALNMMSSPRKVITFGLSIATNSPPVT